MIISSYFALRRGLGVTAIASFFSDEVPKCVIVRIVSYFDLNPLIDSVLFFYDDVLCIDNLVQLRISEFVLIRGYVAK